MRRTVALLALAVTLAAAAAGCASGGGSRASERSAGARARATSTTPRPAPPLHVQLDLVDRSRPAVDPAGTRSAPVRDLPTELYLPGGAGPHPLIVFAHGYDGDPSKFTELFGHWSDAGFAVAAPRFPITYTSDPVGPIARAGDIANQPRDMSFVLDQVLHGPYAGRIDRTRIAAAGLSLGGGTVWGLTTDRCCVDRRVRAAIVMDGNRLGFGDATYRPNRIPILVFHADHDYSLPYSAAQAAYAKLDPPKYFVTIVGALHAQPYENTPVPSDPMVVATSLDFLRAYLLHDAAARARIVTDATVAGVSSAEADPGR